MNRTEKLLAAVLLLQAASFLMGAVGQLYNAYELSYNTKAPAQSVSVTSTSTSVPFVGENGRGAKAVTVRNYGPGDIHVSWDSTTATTANWKIPVDEPFVCPVITKGIGLICPAGITATAQVLGTY